MSATTWLRRRAFGAKKQLEPESTTRVTIIDDHFVESVTQWEDGTEVKVIVGRGSLDLPAPSHDDLAPADGFAAQAV